MPAQVTLSVESLQKIQRLVSKHPAIAQKHVDTAITRSLVAVFGGIKREAPVGVSGDMRNRWEKKTSAFRGRLESNTKYAYWVHEGRGPGKMPPFGEGTPLEKWAKKKGIPPFLIARKIAKKGTKANPFLDRAVENNEKVVNNEFEKALEGIVNDLSHS
jgi:hypothetical protein